VTDDRTASMRSKLMHDLASNAAVAASVICTIILKIVDPIYVKLKKHIGLSSIKD
jgi:hypothetical protein